MLRAVLSVPVKEIGIQLWRGYSLEHAILQSINASVQNTRSFYLIENF